MNSSNIIVIRINLTRGFTSPLRQAASLYERAVNIEETAERHVFLGEALVLAERKEEAMWHYGRAADLFDDREYKVGKSASSF